MRPRVLYEARTIDVATLFFVDIEIAARMLEQRPQKSKETYPWKKISQVESACIPTGSKDLKVLRRFFVSFSRGCSCLSKVTPTQPNTAKPLGVPVFFFDTDGCTLPMATPVESLGARYGRQWPVARMRKYSILL